MLFLRCLKLMYFLERADCNTRQGHAYIYCFWWRRPVRISDTLQPSCLGQTSTSSSHFGCFFCCCWYLCCFYVDHYLRDTNFLDIISTSPCIFSVATSKQPELTLHVLQIAISRGKYGASTSRASLTEVHDKKIRTESGLAHARSWQLLWEWLF